MRGNSVHWESSHTFNPAAVVKDGKVWVIYRAEDDSGQGIGGYTSRLGLASSSDGIHFQPRRTLILFPGDDSEKSREWEGGCEDPRCVETEGGTYVLFYTQYARSADSAQTDLGMATSRDLIHWQKTGPVQGLRPDGSFVTPSKSASLVTEVKHGRLMAAKIAGKYWLYYGEGAIHLLSSPDLKSWTEAPGLSIAARAHRFDSSLAECGPPAVLTRQGIVLIYNGRNTEDDSRDPSLPGGTYCGGEVLLDSKDPSKVLARSDTPFFKPELPWERTGQYSAGTTFLEGLVLFHHKWFLYYGAADTYVGVAVADSKAVRD
jgi:beta-1,2-mannosidase